MGTSTERGNRSRPRGNALVMCCIVVAVSAAIAFGTLGLAASVRKDARAGFDRDAARALAEAGLHFTEHQIRETAAKNPWRPIEAIEAAIPRNFDADGEAIATRIADDQVLEHEGRRYGSFTADAWLEIQGDDRLVYVTSTGYFPNRLRPLAKVTLQSVVQISVRPGEVFDYAYFVHNWGLIQRDGVTFEGNARANGPVDVLGHDLHANGTPRYQHVDDAGNLQGYLDDNGDGAQDGNDGGLYSGFAVYGAQQVTGIGALEDNQHSPLRQIPLPNIARLDLYEERAISTGSGIWQTGLLDESGNPLPDLELVSAVLGDDPGEPEHLVLVGTADAPIRIDGLVVVRGDVVITGVVTGQGSIVAGRNVYVASDLSYANPPATLVPSDNTQASTQDWLDANATADFLGLYAREQIVLGDVTDETWRQTVSEWLLNDASTSHEDAGSDQIPFTRNGKDGEPDTNDDDVLEADGYWSTKAYTQADEDAGLIPAGFSVGDAIPGTGEDADGDGEWDQFDLGLADFDLAASFADSSLWAGNLPAGVTQFSELASSAIGTVQAGLMSQHAVVGYSDASHSSLTLFGSMVCKNDDLQAECAEVTFVHDRRLSAGAMFPNLLPLTTTSVQTLFWRIAYQGDVESLSPKF